MRFFTFIFLLLILQKHIASGQTDPGFSTRNPDKKSPETFAASVKQTAFPVSLYKAATEQSQNLYNGRMYYVYDARMEEHQFFGDRKWQKGPIFYDGQRFDSIPMIYDINRDELVIKHFNGDALLLQSEKVEYFSKENHNFRRFESGKDINPQMRTGFYDILYEGKSKVLARRTKQRQEKIVEKKVIALFPQKDFYYIYKEDRYYPVRSKKSVFAVFPDKKRELRKALREENIKYRKNRDAAITTIVVAYDSLNGAKK